MNDNPKPISDAELVGMMQRNQKALREQIEQLEAELATVKKVAYGNIELLEENQNLKAELARIRAGQEPVAFKKPSLLMDCNVRYSTSTTPQPSAVPDAWKLAVYNVAGYAHLYNSGSGIIHEIRAEHARLLAAAPSAPSAPATVQGDGWIPVSERLPESERTVLAFYLNSHGKGRRVRAEYIAAKTKSADDGWDSDEPADYDEQADEYFWPAGWYEVMDNWDGLTHIVIHEGEVTHWMPLPESPAIAAARQEGKA